MGLTMSQRKAVTKAMATRYRSSSRAVKARVLDELCELTGRHRDHARKALREALGPRRVPEWLDRDVAVAVVPSDVAASYLVSAAKLRQQ